MSMDISAKFNINVRFDPRDFGPGEKRSATLPQPRAKPATPSVTPPAPVSAPVAARAAPYKSSVTVNHPPPVKPKPMMSPRFRDSYISRYVESPFGVPATCLVSFVAIIQNFHAHVA